MTVPAQAGVNACPVVAGTPGCQPIDTHFSNFSIVPLAPTGATIYSGAADQNLYTIDPITGNTTLIGRLPALMYDIAALNGTLYGIDGNGGGSRFYTINPSTGASTLIGNTGHTLNGMVGGGGKLYASGGDSLYTINPLTGTATLVGSGGGGGTYNSSGDLEFDSSGNLYLTSLNGGNDQLFRLSTANGQGTLIGSIGFGNVYGLAFTNGTMYGLTNPGGGGTNRVLTINLTTGVGTQISTYLQGTDGIAVMTPEPATIGMLGLALMGLGVLRRFRSSSGLPAKFCSVFRTKVL
jgi:hypothetical protein